MRSLPLLLTAVALVGFKPAQALAQAPAAGVADTLIARAAADFHEHAPPTPARFRNVRLAHTKSAKSSGAVEYRLCGELQTVEGGDKGDWVPFVVIKTFGYEQWVGNQAKPMCRHNALKWDGDDLSNALQARLAALK